METELAIIALSALSQHSRLDAFRLLVRHEPGGLPAGEVADRLNVPQNTMSSHLAVLARAGLVRQRRDGRSVVYNADLSALSALMLFLARDCCDGRAELCDPLIAELAC